MLFFIGRALDAAQIEDSITATKTKVRSYRDNVDRYHFIVYKKAVEVAEGLDIQPVAYYRGALTILLLGRFFSIYLVDIICFKKY